MIASIDFWNLAATVQYLRSDLLLFQFVDHLRMLNPILSLAEKPIEKYHSSDNYWNEEVRVVSTKNEKNCT